MKSRLLFFALATLAAVTAVAGMADEFVLIPANPAFAFAKTLDPHVNAPGEASPILTAYWLGRHPVTNAEYAEFVADTGHRAPGYWGGRTCPQGRERHPVLSVSYSDVLAFCEWKTSRTPGWRFRPPTEAEWENAAAGATVGNYNAVIATRLLAEDPDRLVTYYHAKSTRQGEQDKLSDVISVSASGAVSGWVNHANYTGFVYTDLFKSINDAGGYTLDWDTFPACASNYGVFDMLGNSWDWTSSVIVAVNGAEQGQSVNAVRGGSWYATKASCALSYRGEGRVPKTCFATVGFRLVAVPLGTVFSIR